MRSHIRLTAAHESLAAFAGGWRRASNPAMHGSAGPSLLWTGPRGITTSLLHTAVLPEPLRYAVRAQNISIFRRVCPCCGHVAEWLTDEQLDAARAEGTAGSVLEVHPTRPGLLAPGLTFAIRHELDCPATEHCIYAMAGASAN